MLDTDRNGPDSGILVLQAVADIDFRRCNSFRRCQYKDLKSNYLYQSTTGRWTFINEHFILTSPEAIAPPEVYIGIRLKHQYAGTWSVSIGIHH